MSRFKLTPQAQADIDDIWNYTIAQWGAARAERYVRQLAEAMSFVAVDPTRGRSCDDVRAGYRKFSVGAHVLFFRLTGDGVDIVRILHQRMDFQRHL